MSTKIGGFDNSPVRISTGRTVKRADNSVNSSQTNSLESTLAETHITDSARALAELEKLAQDLPAVDHARVEQVRNSLSSGSYKIDPEKIADRLLQTEQALEQLK